MPSLLLLLGRFDISLPNQMDFGKFCTFGTGDGFRFPGICHRDRVEHSCSWKQQEVKHFELRKILWTVNSMAEHWAKKSDTLWRPVNVRKESLPSDWKGKKGAEWEREREKNWKNGDIDRNKVNFKYVHAGIWCFIFVHPMNGISLLFLCVCVCCVCTSVVKMRLKRQKNDRECCCCCCWERIWTGHRNSKKRKGGSICMYRTRTMLRKM